MGNADSIQSMLLSLRGSDLNLVKRDTDSGAVQKSGDQGNYFMELSNLWVDYKPFNVHSSL